MVPRHFHQGFIPFLPFLCRLFPQLPGQSQVAFIGAASGQGAGVSVLCHKGSCGNGHKALLLKPLHPFQQSVLIGPVAVNRQNHRRGVLPRQMGHGLLQQGRHPAAIRRIGQHQQVLRTEMVAGRPIIGTIEGQLTHSTAGRKGDLLSHFHGGLPAAAGGAETHHMNSSHCSSFFLY